MYRLLKHFGVIKATVLFTFASILISVVITTTLTTLLSGSIGTTSIIIAIVAPATIAPLFAYITLRLTFQLHITEEKLRRLSTTDELTQAHNRRYFMEMAAIALAGAKRYGDSFSIIIFDIDDFKKINDTYGHVAGDKVLRALSEICMTTIRDTDIFARYGGEEFAFLVSRCSPTNVLQFAERIRIKLAEARVPLDQTDIQFTVSIGAGTFDSTTPDLDTLLMHADAALYTAKKQGKNRTHVA